MYNNNKNKDIMELINSIENNDIYNSKLIKSFKDSNKVKFEDIVHTKISISSLDKCTEYLYSTYKYQSILSLLNRSIEPIEIKKVINLQDIINEEI